MSVKLDLMASEIKRLNRGIPKTRAPRSELTFEDISPEEGARLLEAYKATPKNKKSALTERLSTLEVGAAFKVTGRTLISLKGSIGKYAKTAGRAYKVFPAPDGGAIVMRTE
jgi:hypothetical protein